MLWLNLDAVGTPSVCYDCLKHYAGETSGHAIETHAGANTKIKKIWPMGRGKCAELFLCVSFLSDTFRMLRMLYDDVR